MELGLVNLSKFLEILESKLAKIDRNFFTKLCEKKCLSKTALLKIFENKNCEEYWYMEIHTL